jgi:hypothetical protein
MSHAHLLARAAALLNQPAWRGAAERLLHWCLGHNSLNRSLFSGIGYRQPVGYSFRIPQIPEAMVTGFIGRPDDSPYLEESTATDWNTGVYRFYKPRRLPAGCVVKRFGVLDRFWTRAYAESVIQTRCSHFETRNRNRGCL